MPNCRLVIGMLTPSSNTVLEPVTSAMLAEVEGASAHFSRFRVTQIGLSEAALSQFDDRPILEAASLLADADVDVIAWNGTSGGWLGFEADRRLCERITSETGKPATTSVLSLLEAFERAGVKRFGLVTPYTGDVQSRIMDNFAAAGFQCVSERHAGIHINAEFSGVGSQWIRDMVRRSASEGEPQVITTFCTNLRAAPLVDGMEREINLPIYDTVATSVWKCLKIAQADPTQVTGWGQLFRLDAPKTDLAGRI